jgi:mono/diheme cytochrome c family protein
VRLNRPIFAAIALSSVIFIYLLSWAIIRLTPESSPVARGAAYAGVRGCIDCHGDPENPLADANYKECSVSRQFAGHPAYAVECADAMAYFEVIRLRRSLSKRPHINDRNSLAAGDRLAREYHCFQCHGYLGQGGFQNAGSLKGYVPGYFGTDFRLLTRSGDPESVRAWITHGVDTALLEKPILGPIAEYFIQRQAVNMPSYKSLPPEQIEILVNYVIAINKLGPMTAKLVRSHEEMLQTAN